jgi:hypothetical protein
MLTTNWTCSSPPAAIDSVINKHKPTKEIKSLCQKKSAFCIATSRGQADQIVNQLKQSNFSNNDISVLFPDKETTRDFAHEKNTKAPEGAVTGAGTGGVIGGALGWVAGIGALAIPGVGQFSKFVAVQGSLPLAVFGIISVVF